MVDRFVTVGDDLNLPAAVKVPNARVTGLVELIQDTAAAMIIGGTDITPVYNDATGEVTISFTGSTGGVDAETVRDIVGTALVANTSTGVSITVNDAGDTITLANVFGTTAGTVTQGNDARLSDTRTPTDNTVTNAKVPTGAAINADKLVNGTTNVIMLATERTKLAGIATAATANSTDAFLLTRTNHTGEQAISTVTNLQANLDAKAPLVSPTFTGTVSGVSKTMVGLGNVDNTADSAKTFAATQITSGNLVAARNTASVPHDVWQASGGVWPARPTVPTGARVNAIGYPGFTDLPSWIVVDVDSYTMRTL